MNIMAQAPLGHNNPPDPIDEAVAPFGDAIAEAENWLDGATVETEEQMKAVDAIAKEIRSARSAVDAARKLATDPLHKAWKAEVARWKPTEDDLDRIQKGLAAAVEAFKRRLAEQKAQTERAARAEAERKMREAQRAAALAAETDLEAQRAADRAKADADAAAAAAKAAARDQVKGLRTVWKHEITDHRALLNWIAKNDRDAITAFIEQYANAHYRQREMDGLRVWSEKEAF